MNLQKIETLFRILVTILGIFAVAIIFLASYKFYHGEADPLKGSLNLIFKTYGIALCAMACAIAIGSIIVSRRKN